MYRTYGIDYLLVMILAWKIMQRHISTELMCKKHYMQTRPKFLIHGNSAGTSRSVELLLDPGISYFYSFLISLKEMYFLYTVKLSPETILPRPFYPFFRKLIKAGLRTWVFCERFIGDNLNLKRGKSYPRAHNNDPIS